MLKGIQIIGQRKAFYIKRILECSCARKEAVEIDIFVASTNCDKKIKQSIRIMSRPLSRTLKSKEVEPVEPVQINILPK